MNCVEKIKTREMEGSFQKSLDQVWVSKTIHCLEYHASEKPYIVDIKYLVIVEYTTWLFISVIFNEGNLPGIVPF